MSVADAQQRLQRKGFNCTLQKFTPNLTEDNHWQKSDLILIDIDNANTMSHESFLWEQLQHFRQVKRVPVMLMVPKNLLGNIDSRREITDFITKPIDILELETRIKRTIIFSGSTSSAEIIKFGDLVIDQNKCEVYVQGILVELTFKEYELLKFLVTNQGKVFTRQSLLNELWGMDYYGGDRTVDVHIRRLRGKIEDSEHTFIGTVRNIGYKLKVNK